MKDIKSIGFNKALVNYENTILELSLTHEEFAKKNIFVNALKSMNYLFSNLFKTNLLNKSTEDGWIKCAASIVAFTVAFANLSSCATIILCGLTSILFYAASNALIQNCGTK
mgnify:CR=1 FL=1